MVAHGKPVPKSRNRLTPEQAALVGRVGAHESWARTPDRSARTAPARAAAWSSWVRKADPDGVLSDADRQRRAEHLRSAHMARLGLRSSLNRSKAKHARAEAARLEADARAADTELKQSGDPAA